MGRILRVAVIWVVVLVATGCSESTTVETDAGTEITFDATPPPDTGPPPPDTGPPESDVGTACGVDGDCESGLCVTADEGFAGGYCSAFCGSDVECPTGSICLEVGGGMSLCFDTCDAAAERDCRAGYGCSDSFMLGDSVCLPGCYDDSDCPGDTTCNPDGGSVGEGSCFDPDAAVGDACESSVDCPDESFCVAEFFAGWPGGACVTFGCDVAMNTGCPEGAECLSGRRGGGRCYPGCVEDTDCRDGYGCQPDEMYPDRNVCRPACTDDSVCSGGRSCETDSGRCR